MLVISDTSCHITIAYLDQVNKNLDDQPLADDLREIITDKLNEAISSSCSSVDQILRAAWCVDTMIIRCVLPCLRRACLDDKSGKDLREILWEGRQISWANLKKLVMHALELKDELAVHMLQYKLTNSPGMKHHVALAKLALLYLVRAAVILRQNMGRAAEDVNVKKVGKLLANICDMTFVPFDTQLVFAAEMLSVNKENPWPTMACQV